MSAPRGRAGSRRAEGRQYAFDGIVGPTHNYGGLSRGNVASMRHGGLVSNPRAAALEGLAKMRLVHDLGAGQGVLPPHDRPSLSTLRKLGFAGKDEDVLAAAAKSEPLLLRVASSAAAMWTANAATVAPSADTQDGLVHITPANLNALFHRSIEAHTTYRVLARIFRDESHFVVHEPLPGASQFADEGAANHTRLFAPGKSAVHVFAWGRRAWGKARSPAKFAARQTFEASAAIARLHRLDPKACVYVQQSPEGIDAGAFHTDVLAVGEGAFFMMHERAFDAQKTFTLDLARRLGRAFSLVVATNRELPLADAVAAYPFNSELVALGDGTQVILAPEESRATPSAHRFLERVVEEDNPVVRVQYLDVRQSMRNGGGPACLRQRIPLTEKSVPP